MPVFDGSEFSQDVLCISKAEVYVGVLISALKLQDDLRAAHARDCWAVLRSLAISVALFPQGRFYYGRSGTQSSLAERLQIFGVGK